MVIPPSPHQFPALAAAQAVMWPIHDDPDAQSAPDSGKMTRSRYINKSGYGVNSMWLPEKFYELLPYLYAIGGVIAICYLNTPLGYTSGFLLVLTGGLIFMMRRDYRQGKIIKKN